jgi:hypothetical protein
MPHFFSVLLNLLFFMQMQCGFAVSIVAIFLVNHFVCIEFSHFCFLMIWSDTILPYILIKPNNRFF